MSGWNFDMQISVVFPYTSNKQSERKLREQLIYAAFKIITYLRINFTDKANL